MKKIYQILKHIALALLGLFAVTFTIYYFALDSKLMRKLMPIMTDWHDKQDKKRERLL